MRFSKLLSLVSCSLLLTGVLASFADAQRKDKNKDKDKSNPPVPAINPPTPYSEVRRDNLLNGLQIITLGRASDPILKCDLIIRAGAMFDLAGKTGLAALTQETLLAVNPRLKEEIESLQAKIDWGLSWDTTWFHIETPASNFDTVFEILGRLLVVENVRPDAFKRAHQERLEKVKSVKPTLAEQADEAFFKAIYGDHPYGHNIDGGEGAVSGIKQADVYDFLKRFYIANNVSVIVVGNITHDRAIRPFKAFFGGWAKAHAVPATFRQPAQTVQSEIGQGRGPRRAECRIARRDDRRQKRRPGFSRRRSDGPDFEREAETRGRINRRELHGPIAASHPVGAVLLLGVNSRRSGVRVLT